MAGREKRALATANASGGSVTASSEALNAASAVANDTPNAASKRAPPYQARTAAPCPRSYRCPTNAPATV